MPIPSPSQRRAIEAEPRALLVLAGPGAGKTFCLTERIGYLIEHYGFDPSRICAFTFPGNLTGYPAVTVPAGFSPSALPIGLQIMAGPWDEGTALRVARAVERHVVRPAPKVVYDLLS